MVKGQRVSVSGELGTREYQASDGTMKTVITCRVNQIGLEGSAQAGGSQQGGQQGGQQAQQPQQQQHPDQQPTQGFDDFDDSIPF
jgi:single-stranded DNA-binding protein